MYTFKSQEKSNAKRFLVKTAKVENFEEYLTQDSEGNWGTYLDQAGKPVKAAAVAAWESIATAAAVLPTEEEAVALAGSADEVHSFDADDEPAEPLNDPRQSDPFSQAFGALAMSQLTAPSNTAPIVSAPKANREGATTTAGLRIQKDRPERNGVRRKSAGTVGDKLFALYDKAGHGVTLAQAKALAEEAGLSTTSAVIALYSWRKFNGITGGKK